MNFSKQKCKRDSTFIKQIISRKKRLSKKKVILYHIPFKLKNKGIKYQLPKTKKFDLTYRKGRLYKDRTPLHQRETR